MSHGELSRRFWLSSASFCNCLVATVEANKTVAKDSDASLSTRASAAKDAISDKFDEQKHQTKSDAFEEKAVRRDAEGVV